MDILDKKILKLAEKEKEKLKDFLTILKKLEEEKKNEIQIQYGFSATENQPKF